MDEIQALVKLVRFKVEKITEIPNEYDRSSNPWWLLTTYHGDIKIGWRWRVMEIDWSGLGENIDPNLLESDNVTKGETFIHAWSYGKAICYLNSIMTITTNQKYMRNKDA